MQVQANLDTIPFFYFPINPIIFGYFGAQKYRGQAASVEAVVSRHLYFKTKRDTTCIVSR
jgi:hypothetical protein